MDRLVRYKDLRDVVLFRAEISLAARQEVLRVLDEFEANRTSPVVYCPECKYCHEAHYEDPGEPPYIKLRCTNKYSAANSSYRRMPNDFCSYGERKAESVVNRE